VEDFDKNNKVIINTRKDLTCSSFRLIIYPPKNPVSCDCSFLNLIIMYIVRDIFHLKFGHFKDAKTLLDEVRSRNMLPDSQSIRVLSDFTGDAYRLIMEESFTSLADYEESLSNTLKGKDWQEWYEKFKLHVENSHREILKLIM
jgi:hypothetical protein